MPAYLYLTNLEALDASPEAFVNSRHEVEVYGHEDGPQLVLRPRYRDGDLYVCDVVDWGPFRDVYGDEDWVTVTSNVLSVRQGEDPLFPEEESDD